MLSCDSAIEFPTEKSAIEIKDHHEQWKEIFMTYHSAIIIT